MKTGAAAYREGAQQQRRMYKIDSANTKVRRHTGLFEKMRQKIKVS